MRLIILAAGQGYKLDNFNKILIKDPVTGKTLLERYLQLFSQYEITIVLGYKAIEVMNQFPSNLFPINYIYNHEWKTTKNSSSLALALDDKPCVIISGDLFFDEKMVELISKGTDTIFVHKQQNKTTDIRCKCDKNDRVTSIYWSKEYDNDYETLGIFKIMTPKILKEWKNNCIKNKDKFVAQNLPYTKFPFHIIDKKDIFFHEINTHQDYIRLMEISAFNSTPKWLQNMVKNGK